MRVRSVRCRAIAVMGARARSTLLRLLILALALVCTRGCVQREYTYTRKEPAIFRKSATVFTVRIRVDRGNGSVVWLEEVHDAEG